MCLIRTMGRRPNMSAMTQKRVRKMTKSLFGDELHAKRVESLATGVMGVLEAGRVGVTAIGRGLAAARGLVDKHATKQVSGLLGNAAVVVDDLMPSWVSYVVGKRSEIRVNLDWTDFDADDQSTLMLSMQTSHGRNTPLLWMTVVKSSMKGQRNAYEDDLLSRLRDLIDESVQVTVVADRGFGDHKLLAYLDELGFDYVIRFRGSIHISDGQTEPSPAAGWVGKNGRMRVIREGFITQDMHAVPLLVCVQDKGMKEPWLLACKGPSRGTEAKKIYGKRFSCEETYRDIKDLRFGMGMSWGSITKPERRDRMFLIASMAIVLLTLLGAAGEAAGLDRLLKTNTSKKRTLSLFRQGCRWYELMENMPEERRETLLDAFGEQLQAHSMMKSALGIV